MSQESKAKEGEVPRSTVVEAWTDSKVGESNHVRRVTFADQHRLPLEDIRVFEKEIIRDSCLVTVTRCCLSCCDRLKKCCEAASSCLQDCLVDEVPDSAQMSEVPISMW